MIYLELFWTFFKIGSMGFGGGYAVLKLIQEQAIESMGWLTMQELADIITISEITPGPIALNAATFIGTSVAGVGGAAIATIGYILPALILSLLLAFLFFKFRSIKGVQTVVDSVKPGVVAMIAGAGVSLFLLAFFGVNEITEAIGMPINWTSLIIFVLAFFVLRKFKVNPIWVIIGSGVLGLALYQFMPMPGFA